mmetsp:Transcript_7731/g.14040  ORF Transcript_7731/g.14040 Transcript_7731/m.14040 type:complete len:85 (+) Transcript_7731:190-444(+)
MKFLKATITDTATVKLFELICMGFGPFPPPVLSPGDQLANADQSFHIESCDRLNGRSEAFSLDHLASEQIGGEMSQSFQVNLDS